MSVDLFFWIVIYSKVKITVDYNINQEYKVIYASLTNFLIIQKHIGHPKITVIFIKEVKC